MTTKLFVFENDFVLESVGRGQDGFAMKRLPADVDGCRYEAIAQQLFKDGGHALLLRDRAVILDGEDDGIRRCDEGRLGDRLHDLAKRDFRGERVAVVNDGLSVVAVPTVELDAATARLQYLYSGKSDILTGRQEK